MNWRDGTLLIVINIIRLFAVTLPFWIFDAGIGAMIATSVIIVTIAIEVQLLDDVTKQA